jgi:hypothetical protein
MIAFVKYILKITVVFILCAYTLDFCFTYIYNITSPQNKAQYIISLKNKKFDYIFIGSSRVENSVIALEIEKKTNKKTINLGVQGATIKDLVFITNLLTELNVKYEKLFFQLDYKINDINEFSKKFQTELFPFLGTNKIIDSYVLNSRKDKIAIKYMPFYKYNLASHNLGFRNIFLTVFNFKREINKNNGYVPLYGSGEMKTELLPKFNSKNQYFNKLITTKKAVFFSCPLFSTINRNNYFYDLKRTLPALNDFSNSIKERVFYKDSYHLNNNGSVVFTNILIEKLKL